MELRDFFILIRRSLPLALVGALIALAFGILWLFSVITYFQQEIDFSLVRQVQNAPAQFLQDGYYAIESQRLFGDRLSRLLLSEKESRAIAETIHPKLTVLRVERLTPADVRIVIRGSTKDILQRYAQQLEDHLSEHLMVFSDETGEAFVYGVLAKTQESQIPLPPLVPFFGMLIAAGGIFGVLLVFLKEYMKG